jgi:hypothetical protein
MKPKYNNSFSNPSILNNSERAKDAATASGSGKSWGCKKRSPFLDDNKSNSLFKMMFSSLVISKLII